MTGQIQPHTGANSGKAPRPARNIHSCFSWNIRLMWSSTISTSATVLMISRCPGDQTRNDCNRYRSVQPVNRYVSCSCYPLSSVFVFLYQSPPGFLFLQVTNHIRSICCRRSCSRFSWQPPDRFPLRCDSRSTLSGSAVSRSDMADRSRSCPAIS